MTDCGREGIDPLGGLGGSDRRPERLGRPVRRSPVVGELCGGPGRTRLGELRSLGQYGGEALVQRPAFGGQEVGGDDLAEQRVTQSQGAGRSVRGQHAGRNRFADRLVQVGRRSVRDGRDELLRDGPAGECNDAHHTPRSIREGGHLARQDLAQRPRQRPATTALVGRHQLFDEEGVALGPGVDAIHEPVVHRMTAQGIDLSRDVVTRQAGEIDPARPGIPLQATEPARDRMAHGEVVGPHAQHEQESFLVEVASQERHEIAGRAIDPVQVLEHERGGRLGGQVAEQPEDQAEEPRLIEPAARVGSLRRVRRLAVRGGRPGAVGRGQRADPADPREQPPDLVRRRAQQPRHACRRQPPEEAPQRLGEWRVGHPAGPDVQATALEHDGPVGAGSFRELGDQPRLPDAGLAREDDDLGCPLRGARHGRLERPEFGRSADESWARDGAGHGRESTPGPSL